MQKKRKQTLTAADEPESKINKTETTAAEAPQGTSVENPAGILVVHWNFGNNFISG